MPAKAIRVFWSPFSHRFYASRAWKVFAARGKQDGEVIQVTGEKFDVTDDIKNLVLRNNIVFEPEPANKPPDQLTAVELALEIADYAAPAELEAICMPVDQDDETWYDLDSIDDNEKQELAGVIRYCELHYLIKRHKTKPNLFQTLEP